MIMLLRPQRFKFEIFPECPNGRYGENCSEICPVNMYGELCSKRCNCTPTEECNREYGCLSIILYVITVSKEF